MHTKFYKSKAVLQLKQCGLQGVMALAFYLELTADVSLLGHLVSDMAKLMGYQEADAYTALTLLVGVGLLTKNGAGDYTLINDEKDAADDKAREKIVEKKETQEEQIQAKHQFKRPVKKIDQELVFFQEICNNEQPVNNHVNKSVNNSLKGVATLDEVEGYLLSEFELNKSEYRDPTPEEKMLFEEEKKQALHPVNKSVNNPVNNSSDKEATFDDFWAVYPARHGRKIGKKVSEKLFERLTSDQKKVIIIAVRHYIENLETTGLYAKDPERFLRNNVWEEWVESPSAGLEVDPAKKKELAIKKLLAEEQNFINS